MRRLSPALLLITLWLGGCGNEVGSSPQLTQVLPNVPPAVVVPQVIQPVAPVPVDPNHVGLTAASPASMGADAHVLIDIDPNNQVVAFSTTLVVPAQPPAGGGTFFLFPALEPGGGGNYQPLVQGGLESVLTWGASCAPNQAPQDANYTYWWVSAQYFNSNTQVSNFHGCYGGSTMPVSVGDHLRLVMTLQGTVWTQKVTDLANGASVSYSIDLMGQWQNNLIFVAQLAPAAPVSDLIFLDSSITVVTPLSGACTIYQEGPRDFAAQPSLSEDRLTCTLPRVVLRTKGVAATDPN